MIVDYLSEPLRTPRVNYSNFAEKQKSVPIHLSFP